MDILLLRMKKEKQYKCMQKMYKLESQKELRALLMEQACMYHLQLKGNDFYEIIKHLFER